MGASWAWELAKVPQNNIFSHLEEFVKRNRTAKVLEEIRNFQKHLFLYGHDTEHQAASLAYSKIDRNSFYCKRFLIALRGFSLLPETIRIAIGCGPPGNSRLKKFLNERTFIVNINLISEQKGPH